MPRKQIGLVITLRLLKKKGKRENRFLLSAGNEYGAGGRRKGEEKRESRSGKSKNAGAGGNKVMRRGRKKKKRRKIPSLFLRKTKDAYPPAIITGKAGEDRRTEENIASSWNGTGVTCLLKEKERKMD